jgi:aminomethyltransferase
VRIDGKPAGEITSGNFSPVLDRGIGLAFLPPFAEPDLPVEVEVRGRTLAARVVPTPFVSKKG